MAVDLDHIRGQWAARRRNGILRLTRKADRPDEDDSAEPDIAELGRQFIEELLAEWEAEEGSEEKCLAGENAGLPGPCPSGREEDHHANAAPRAQSLAGKLSELPGHVAQKVRQRVAEKYEQLEARYGKPMALTVLAAGIAGTMTPVPAGGLLAAAPLLGAAELYLRLRGGNSAKSFDESKHPRGQPGNAGEFAPASGGGGKKPKPGKPAKKPAPKEEESHPGAAHGSEVKVKLTKERAAPRNAKGKIDPIPVQTQLSKQETGRVAEAGIRAYLRDIEGISDTVALNAGKTNESIDLFGDSMAPEVKGGLCSNSVKAQQWRITFSMELGAKEQAEYDALSEDQQKAWREKRQRACLERKLSLLKKISKERGKKINPVTYTGIVNPDKRTIDIYKTDGYHQRLDWNDPKAKYVASVQYDHAPGDSGSAKSFYRRKGWVTLEPSGTHVYIDGDNGEITAGPPHLTGRKPSELVRERVGERHGEKHPVTGEPGPKKPQAAEDEAPAGFHDEATGDEKKDKKKFGKSKAKVRIQSEFHPEQEHELLNELTLGESPASLVGAPDDAEVTARLVPIKNAVELHITVKHSAFVAERRIVRNKDGTRRIINDEFWMESDKQGAGLGAEVFGRQVENAIEAGFDRIECHAAKKNPRDPDTPHNGYYTWPRFGYDQSLEDFDEFDAAEFRLKKAIRKNFPEAKSVLDVMNTPEGRDWWKKNGDDLHFAKFDLSEGSRSRKVFDTYLEERAARPTKKAAFDMTTKADEPEDENPHVEEIELSEEDEAALDRAWEKLDAETEGE